MTAPSVLVIDDDTPEGREIVAMGKAIQRARDSGITPATIAAAGMLLEACRHVRDGLDGGTAHPGRFASVLDAAIIAAEGRRKTAPAGRFDLIAACRDVLPDLEHYAGTHGPGPDRRLAHLRRTIEQCEAAALAMHAS